MWIALPLFALVACAPEAPLVAGVPAEPLLAPAPEEPAPEEPVAAEPPAAPTAAAADAPYQRAAHVYVDVPYLGGKLYSEVRDLVADQLGDQRGSRELPQRGAKELNFVRGDLRTEDDRIFFLRIPLPNPMQRADALQMCGFPPQVKRAIGTSREYRLNHEWGFRRVRMERLGRDNDLVTEIEAWRWVPGEHNNRR
jgi:hypothetical protein